MRIQGDGFVGERAECRVERRRAECVAVTRAGVQPQPHGNLRDDRVIRHTPDSRTIKRPLDQGRRPQQTVPVEACRNIRCRRRVLAIVRLRHVSVDAMLILVRPLLVITHPLVTVEAHRDRGLVAIRVEADESRGRLCAASTATWEPTCHNAKVAVAQLRIPRHVSRGANRALCLARRFHRGSDGACRDSHAFRSKGQRTGGHVRALVLGTVGVAAVRTSRLRCPLGQHRRAIAKVCGVLARICTTHTWTFATRQSFRRASSMALQGR
mmetsp:Transcript_59026/g.175407  ORF Transcript_59026/g.175407 Transcript_59026/m.175407 type:complete len:268 (-) Transcript_59026:438-1241(-)